MIALSLPIEQTPPVDDVMAWVVSAYEDDPLASVALAYAYLDPYSVHPEVVDSQLDWYEAGDPVVSVWGQIRAYTPEHYPAVVGGYHQHDDKQAYEEWLTTYCMEQIFPGGGNWILDIESLQLGSIDYDLYGAETFDETWFTKPDAVNTPFKAANLVYDISEEDALSFEAIELVANDLLRQPSRTLRDIGHLLRWLINDTGNTLANLSYEDEIYFDPPGWHDLASISAIQDEAEYIYNRAMKGSDALNNDPLLFNCLLANLKTADWYTQIDPSKPDNYTYRMEYLDARPKHEPFTWIEHDKRNGEGDHPAFDGLRVLPFRRAPKEEERFLYG